MATTVTHIDTNITTGVATTQTVTVTAPTGIQDGDLLLAVVVQNKSGTYEPSGWTQLNGAWSAANTYSSQIFYRIASGESGNYVFTAGDNASPLWAAIACYRGVDPVNPIHAYSTTITSGTTNPITTPSVTTTVVTYPLYLRTVRISTGGTLSTFTASGTERFDGGNTGGVVAYSGGMYDNAANSAAGSLSGMSITATNSANISDSVSRTICLTALDRLPIGGRKMVVS